MLPNWRNYDKICEIYPKYQRLNKMQEFKLTDPYGTAPSKAPFVQSVSQGIAWHNLPVMREYTLGQLLDQTIARCGENDAVVYADRDFRLTWYQFGEEVDRLARGLMALGVKKGEKIALWATNVPHWVVLMFAAAKIGAVLCRSTRTTRSARWTSRLPSLMRRIFLSFLAIAIATMFR